MSGKKSTSSFEIRPIVFPSSLDFDRTLSLQTRVRIWEKDLRMAVGPPRSYLQSPRRANLFDQ